MKNFFGKIWARKWLAAAVVLILAVIIFFLTGDSKKTSDGIPAEKGEVILEIDVVGKVKPSRSLDMAFLQNGKISQMNFGVGEEVRIGQVLAALDNGELVAQLRQAEASLAIQEAKLEELEKGTRLESLAVKQAELTKGRVDLDNEYSGIFNVLNSALVKADNGVTKQVDSLFSEDNTTAPKLTFISGDSQAVIDSEWQRRLAGEVLREWSQVLAVWRADFSEAEKEAALAAAAGNLSVVRNFLARLSVALQNATNLSSSVLEIYNTNLNSARTGVNEALTSVTEQQKKISAQKEIVSKLEKEYALAAAGNTPEQIAAQEAQVAQAAANVVYAGAQLEKTYLRAPFAGQVTRKIFDIGDIVSVNQAVISLIGAGYFEIEANVAESDVAKIEIGDSARVTLDAYGDEPVFQAVVSSIDLAATVVEGVATYKTVLQFNEDDNRILAGLTANVDILADKKESVIFVPTRSIFEENGKKYVRVISASGEQEEREVTAGLRGSDGRTEIVSGLEEGEIIAAK